MRNPIAFTLIELLVTVAIIGILAAIFAGIAGKMKQKSNEAAGLHTLRNIGTAILAYTADHAGVLPGPLWPGQIPTYNSTRSGRLVVEIAEYMDIGNPPDNTLITSFIPSAFESAYPGDLAASRPYVMNHNMQVNDDSILSPWGNLAVDEEATPRPLAVAATDTWAISDADQQHSRVSSAPWAASTTEKPYHRERMAFFLSGSVNPVTDEDLELPVAGGD